MRRLLCFLLINSCLLSTTATADFATDSSWMYQSIDRSVNDAYRRNNDTIINNYNNSSNSGGSSSIKRTKYRAIAFSNKFNNTTWSEHYSSKEEAINAAIEVCGNDDCQMAAASTDDDCVAIAVGNNTFGGGYGKTSAQAFSLAIKNCGGRANNCLPTASYCPDGNGKTYVTAHPENSRPTKHHAIFFSNKTGSYGVAWNQRSTEIARKEAFKACIKKDCEMAVYAGDNCIALAVGKNYFAGGYGKNLGLATSMALGDCRTRTENCQIMVTYCPGDLKEEYTPYKQ